MPPTASHPPRRYVILLQKFNKSTQLLSDRSALFVTHFTAFIERLAGIGSTRFFSVNPRPGTRQGCGEQESGPTAGGAGPWVGSGSRRGLSRDSQGWQCPHGSDGLLTLFQNNENLII